MIVLHQRVFYCLDCQPFREYVTNNTMDLVNPKKKKMKGEYTLDKEDLVNVIEKVNKLVETDELKLKKG